MKQPKPQRLNAQISEEAAEWFVEFRSGPMEASSRASFDAWIRTSPEHLRAYLEIAAIWDESSDINGLRTADVDQLIALSRVDHNVVPLNRAQPTRARDRVRPRALRHASAIAASLAGIIAAGAVIIVNRWQQAPVYQTAVGEQRSVVLPDGSVIDLNARSRVRVTFTAARRRVELLQGEALFKVARNAERPFIVQGDTTQVRAVGTQFDVNINRLGTVVTVVEGRVAISKAADAASEGINAQAQPALMLAAGEQAVASTATIARAAATNVSAATAWRRHELIFDGVPLVDVADAFNRYSKRKLIVEDSSGAPLRLSGAFDTNPEFLIRYLRERPDVEVSESDVEIRLRHRAVDTNGSSSGEK